MTSMLLRDLTLESLRTSPAVLSMWSCTVKMDEENLTTAGLTQENGFGSAELGRLLWLVKGSAALCTCRKECNKYDLTATQCFWFACHSKCRAIMTGVTCCCGGVKAHALAS